ncbi:M6 family metalloprotease domain-containing protein [Vicingaceae bacterium]|nr:M6 family metalloprotease domain-containing protein [Vicingaceae bacterium]
MKQLLTLCLSIMISVTASFAQHTHHHLTGPTNCSSSPLPMDVLQPDGKTVTVVSKGNMSHYWTETEDGYTVVSVNNALEYATKVGNDLIGTGVLAHNAQDRILGEIALVSAISKSLQPAVRNLKNTPLNYTPNGSKTYPTTGNIRVLALLIDYPDLPSQYTVADLQSLLTNPNHRSGDGSFKSFYTDASFNQLSITVDVMGWYRAQNNYAYYSDSAGTARAAKLVREAVDAAETAGANFANYDNDNDGDVDGILVVHSGPGAETGIPNRNRHIWSHRWVMSGGSSIPGGGSVTYDGKFINDYMINPETRGTLTNPRLVGIGVFCHEFGHNLGLPDLYDTDASNGDSEGVGNWAVMAGGTWLGGEHRPGGFCAWSKEDLGWITPTALTTNSTGTYSLKPAGNNQNTILKITTSEPTEYFLLENRQKIGRDLELPGHGLAIWHINTTKTNSFGNRVNGDETLKGVDLEEADGLADLDNEVNRGDGGDVYPGTTNKTDFNNTSNPNSQLYNNSNSGLIVRNITERGDSIILTLGAAAATCSGLTTLTTPSGSFDDGSGMMANYDDNQNCTWLIQPTAATSITLNFNNFSTETSNDEVRVYDGNSSSATLLGTFSGLSQTIPAITSTGGALFIEFTTNNSITEAGWDVSYTSVTPPTATCSGLTTLTAASGTFEDGSSINDYTNNLSCTWLIQPTGASSITLNFSAFSTATNDVVNVYDGPSVASTLIGTYNGLNQFIPTINSTGGALFIEFITNSSVTEAGWDANYTSTNPPIATCSGTTTLTSSTGVFDDGSATANYTDNLSCQWLIQPAAATSITLSFSAFDTETTNDVVNIYDGSATSATLLGSFSGNSVPNSVTSTGGAMLVEFSTNSSVTSGGWNANYTSTATSTPPTCSGLTTLTATTGFFDDGSGPSANYGDNSNCSWLIQPTGATSISLTFPLFFTEATNDVVNVYDGASNTTSLIGSYSGTSAPATIISTGGSLFIEFITNGSIVNTGWDAFYSSTGSTPTCSGLTTLTTPTGSFNDGSGLSNYTNNLACTWLVQPIGATNINANFTTLLTELNNDIVNIYDGTSNTAPLIGTYSGSSLPPSFTANSGAMFIEFITNGSVVNQGWNINYSSIIAPPVLCSGTTTLTANTGSFSDGSGNSNYLDNTNCSWLIQPTNGQNVVLNFTNFDTENNFDVVEIYDGLNTSSPLLASYSGNGIPASVTSSGPNMFVRFSSDFTITRQGWDANYVTTTSSGSGCSGLTTLVAPTGIITDGSGTGNYGNNSNCSWLIQPAGAISVTAAFNALNTQVFTDQVFLYDGLNATGTLIGSFSGSNIPSGTFTANSGSMFIQFTTDNSIVDQGWEISYNSTVIPPTQFCNGLTTLVSNNGSFSDGSGANNYVENSNCEWLIQPANGLPITLNFTSFDTEQGFDQVNVYDGSSITSTLIGSFSGNTLPPSVTSSGGNLLVVFSSDPSVNAAGWDANYTTSTSSASCSGLTTLTAVTGTVSDGSGAANYSDNLACTWLIQPSGATTVTALFLTLNTEINNDQVIIYDGSSNTSPVIGSYSGTTAPLTPIVASSGSMFIEFLTNGSIVDQGWDIIWTATTPPPAGPCSGLTNLTANNGAFSDGSGTNNYANNSNCEWLIQPVNGQPITLNFTAFDLEQGFDQVNVYDGTSVTAPLLGRFSGNTIPPSITSTAGDMFVVFNSDGFINGLGWDANYITSSTSPTITLNPDTMFLASGAGSNGVFNINATTSWTITDDATWLITAAINGSGGRTSNALALTANTGADRIAKVICRGPLGIYDSMIVVQAGIAAPQLSVSPKNITIAAPNGSNGSVTITANTSWSASTLANWMAITPSSGNGNSSTTIEATSTNSGAARSGLVIFEDFTRSIRDTVFVTQDAAGPFIDLDNGPISLGFASGSNSTFNLASNVSWTITNNAPWLSISPISGSNNGTLTATTISDNTTGVNRSVWIFASDGTISDSIEVIQLNGTSPSLTLSKSVITLGPNNASSDNFDVLSNVDWSLSGIPAWLNLTPISGVNNSNISVTTQSANNSGTVRTVTINAISTNPLAPSRSIIINQLDGSSPYLGTSIDTVILSQFQGSTNSFNVLSNVTWTAQEGLTWLLLGPSNGVNNATITLQTSSSNLSTSARSGDVTILSSGLPSKVVHIIQEPTLPNLGVSRTDLFLAGAANSTSSFSVLGNTSNWTITNGSSWLNISPNTGSFTRQITVSANSDNTGQERKDTLYISAMGAATRVVIVTQDSMASIGINEIQLADNLSIYPNPTLGVVTVKIDENLSFNDYQIKVTNVLGSQIGVSTNFVASNVVQLDITGNRSGIYFLTIDNGKKRVVKKISLIESF